MSIHPLIAAGIPESVLIGVIVVVVLLFSLLLVALSRYRRCPSDKIMVIYGKVGQNKDGSARSARCIHGGAAMVWPVIQAYEYLDLTPLSISVDLKSALSRQNIRIDVPARFTVGISTEPGTMQNAAERLLGLKLSEIQELSKDIIFGQMRLIIATMDIEEINTDRDKFLAAVSACVESELRKIGLRLINVNVTDISDESGYIEALGKEAAAKAINEARISVAEQNREGSIGEANAVRDQRISVAAANASAVDGENTSKANVAKSDATRREQEAEALRRAVTAEKLAEAKAREDSYVAEQAAEKARAARELATQQADIIVKAQIEKEKRVLEAEAALVAQPAVVDLGVRAHEHAQDAVVADGELDVALRRAQRAHRPAAVVLRCVSRRPSWTARWSWPSAGPSCRCGDPRSGPASAPAAPPAPTACGSPPSR